MILFPEFFRRHMIKKISEVYSPKYKEIDKLELPKNSTLYHYSITPTTNMIEKNGFLSTNKNFLVKTIDKYAGDNVGTFIFLQQEVRPYILANEKHAPKLNFIKNNTIVMKSDTIVVKNFLGLQKFYRYPANPLVEYWRFKNTLESIVVEINKELEREIFLPIEIETSLHYNKFIELMNRQVTTSLLKLIPSYDTLLMFELWRMIFLDTRESSIFNKINKEKFKKVHLMFYIGNRTVIINFAVFLNTVMNGEQYAIENGLDLSSLGLDVDMLIDTYQEETAVLKNMNKLKDTIASKLFYIMLNKVKTQALMVNTSIDSEIKQKSTLLQILTKDNNTKKEDTKSTPTRVVKEETTKIEKQPMKQVEEVQAKEETECIETDKVTEDTLDVMLDTFGKDIESSDTIEELDQVYDDEVDTTDLLEDDLTITDIKSIDNYSNHDIEKDINGKPEIGSRLIEKLDALVENKILTKSKAEKYIDMMKETRNKKITINGEVVSIGDVLNEDLNHNVPNELIEIKASNVVKDKDILKNTSIENMKHYLKNNHEKLMIRTLMSIENTSFIVSDIDIEKESSILGTSVYYTVSLKGLDGTSDTIKFTIPDIDKETGTYKLSKNEYIMRKQRNDLPIRKIAHNQVSLNSDYGKLFITRGVNKSNDKGYWLKNQLLKLYNNDIISNFVTNLKVFELEDVTLPEDYTTMAKYVKMFNYQDMSFNFNYHTRKNNLTEDEVNYLEEDGVIVGTKTIKEKSYPIILRFDNVLYYYKNNEFIEIDTFYHLLEIDHSNAPDEIITIKVFKTSVPLILLLCYYYGLEKVLDHYKLEYYYEKTSVRVDQNRYLVIKFLEDKLVIERTKVTDILFSGLAPLKDITKLLKRLNTKNECKIVFNLLEYSLLVRNEIPTLDELFISPTTLELLTILKLPKTFRGLLFKAVDMLLDDKYKNPKDISETVFKGYDRFSSMMYKEIALALRDQKNKSEFTRAKLNINPYSVIKKLNEDSTTLLVNDLNPIASIKQYEDVTFLGSGGRSKESLSRSTRGYDDNDIGILSEANKDSGDVGITSYLVATPTIANSLGMISTVEVNEDTNWSKLISTPAMLAPFANKDDVKRLVFSGIQAEHVIPVIGMDVPRVRTNYDTLIANRLGGKYAIISKSEGNVVSVDSKQIVVRYKDEKQDTTYKLISWYSKTESNICYKHTMVPNIQPGDKIEKDDVLGYINSFFRPDPYDKKRVIYLQHKIARIAFMEDLTTYEDSTALSREFASKLNIENIKIANNIVEKEDNIVYAIKIGSEVKAEEALITVTNSAIDTTGLTEEEIELMNDTNNNTLRSKYNGIVDNIEIYYNCNIEDLSDSLKELVKQSDKRLKEKTGYTGKVNGSYSINGVSLLEGKIEIKVYISVIDDMGIADKAIYGNQLKCTVGDIFNSIVTYDDKKPVDATFSTTSFEKRITPSLINSGLLSEGAIAIEEKAISYYFG